MYTYIIGDRVYTQKPLVLGQMRQLITLLKDFQFRGDITIPSLIAALGDKLSGALAIVLTEQGTSLKDKNLDALEREIDYSISPDTAIQVIEDFFDCNPIASLFQRLSGTANKVSEMIQTGLKTSVSTSVEEISQGGTQSSGDIPSLNASHTLNTV